MDKHNEEDSKQLYISRQKEKGFSQGDSVEVICTPFQVPNFVLGWGCEWTPQMDYTKGQQGTVNSVEDDTGILVDFPDGSAYYYPFYALKKVLTPKVAEAQESPEEVIKRAYLTMQANCDIRPGDKVKVLRAAKSSELGWSNGWNSMMDYMIGKTFKVTLLDEHGVHTTEGIDVVSTGFGLPFFVLEKIVDSDAKVAFYKVEHGKCPENGSSYKELNKAMNELTVALSKY